MNNAIFTQLSETEIRGLIRTELEAFFHDKFPTVAQKKDLPALGGIALAEEVTGLKRPTNYALVQRREIPYFKKAKKLYFKREELVAWIEEGRKATAGEIRKEAEMVMVRNHKVL